MQHSLSEILENRLSDDENIILADGFENAFLGIGRQFGKPLAIYDRGKCLDILMEDGMDYEEANDYFSFNVEGSYVGEQTPIFLEK
jgi:hypothetical protein